MTGYQNFAIPNCVINLGDNQHWLLKSLGEKLMGNLTVGTRLTMSDITGTQPDIVSSYRGAEGDT